ncbi:uncharacterized protein LOC143613153 [Bidens hawaiensis]|uniref:uncharacterized protein LOC143562513 n=1 Tax=Bidens hawaiensis TaxID=980011 RepID=UPI00404A2A08
MYRDVFGQDLSLVIRQGATSAPGEWDVTLENTSPCTITQATLYCSGFQSHKGIVPTIVVQQGDVCVLNYGWKIYPKESIHFTYAWENQFAFRELNETKACS